MTTNLPDSWEGLLDSRGLLPRGAQTPVESALEFDPEDPFGWTAPPAVGRGDVVFFHYAARASARARTLRRAAERDGLLTPSVVSFLDRAETDAAQYAGRVFAVGVLAGPAEPSADEDYNPHWRSRLYAPLASVHRLDYPLELRAHEDALPRPTKTNTELTAAAFAALKARLLKAGNVLPAEVTSAKPGKDGFESISPSSWRQVSCRPGQRFAHETDVRGYLANYLLEELKDPGSTVYYEARCIPAEGGRGRRRAGGGRAKADYIVRLGGQWTPVEAKRSLWSWPDLLEQVAQYVGVQAFDVAAPSGARQRVPAADHGACIVIDQDGMYLVRDGDYIESGPGRPLWSRHALTSLAGATLRRRLLRMLS
jgi:hypothetical protein